MDWKHLASNSPYQTAVAVKEAMHRGDIPEASAGVEELIDALSRSDKRALRSHLIRLMTHVIKWQLQPDKRSRSWRTSIRNARREIAEIQEDTPSLNRAVLEAMWEACLEAARGEAEADMEQDCPVTALSWADIFETEYDLR